MKAVFYKNVHLFVAETEDEGRAARAFGFQFGNDVSWQGKSADDLRTILSRYGADDPGTEGIFALAVADHGVADYDDGPDGTSPSAPYSRSRIS